MTHEQKIRDNVSHLLSCKFTRRHKIDSQLNVILRCVKRKNRRSFKIISTFKIAGIIIAAYLSVRR